MVEMTEEEKDEQRINFAYGNLAASSNHKPQYSAFKKVAFDMGWSEERFVKWANTKSWWQGPVQTSVPERGPAQLVVLRAQTIAMKDNQGERFFKDDQKFTCDDCGARSTCIWVFDGYNTDGDCLAEK